MICHSDGVPFGLIVYLFFEKNDLQKIIYTSYLRPSALTKQDVFWMCDRQTLESVKMSASSKPIPMARPVARPFVDCNWWAIPLMPMKPNGRPALSSEKSFSKFLFGKIDLEYNYIHVFGF